MLYIAPCGVRGDDGPMMPSPWGRRTDESQHRAEVAARITVEGLIQDTGGADPATVSAHGEVVRADSPRNAVLAASRRGRSARPVGLQGANRDADHCCGPVCCCPRVEGGDGRGSIAWGICLSCCPAGIQRTAIAPRRSRSKEPRSYDDGGSEHLGVNYQPRSSVQYKPRIT